MKILCFIFFGFIVANDLFGQNTSDLNYFYTKEWKVTYDTTQAYYSRILSRKVDGYYVIMDSYYKTNTHYMTGVGKFYNEEFLHEGLTTWYHENGKIRKTANYENGKLLGEVKEYYENGTMLRLERYDADAYYICQYWDENGNTLLVNGTGYFKEKNEQSNYPEIHVDVVDSLIRGSYTFRQEKGDTLFFVTEKKAEYDGGIVLFYQYIGNKIKYPVNALRMGVEGKVYIQFVVDKDGSLTEVEVTKGIGMGCDEEALRVVKDSKIWIPAEYKNKRVKSLYTLPIVFKLE